MVAHMSPEYITQNKGPRILACFWSLTSLMIVVVCTRLFIRAKLLHNFGADDWLILVSMLWSTAFTILTTVNVSLGYGRHADVITNHLSLVLLLDDIDFLLAVMSFCLPKLAIAALLNRLFSLSRPQRIMLWGLTGSVFVVSCVTAVIIFTMCNPPQAQWDPSLIAQGATCRNPWILVRYSWFNGALAGFCDLFLGIYPTVIVSKLQMSLKKRLAVCAALGMAGISAAMVVVKCLQLPGLAHSKDPTYKTADLVIWTSIESNVNILASCIPTLQPVLDMILGKRPLHSSKDDYNYNYNYKDYKYYKESEHQTDRCTRKKNKSQQHDDLSGFSFFDSQESVMRNTDDVEAYGMGQIRRTDDVTVAVEYESSASRSGNGQPQGWPLVE